MARITLEPLWHVVVKELLAPDHARKSLPLDLPGVGTFHPLLEAGIELIRLTCALRHERVEAGETAICPHSAQPQPNCYTAACRNYALVPEGGACAGVRGIHSGHVSVDDAIVDAVFPIALAGIVTP